jgi:hypothetical protein
MRYSLLECDISFGDMLVSTALTYVCRSLSIEMQHHSYLVNRITTVDNHGCALHKARFAAGQEENAICHFLGTSHAAHGCDSHGWLEDFGVRFGHWRVDHAWTDTVDPDLVFGVLYSDRVSLCPCGAVTVLWEA